MAPKDWALATTLRDDVTYHFGMTAEEARSFALSMVQFTYKFTIADLLVQGYVTSRGEIISYPLMYLIARDGEMYAVFATNNLLKGKKEDRFVTIPASRFNTDLIRPEWLKVFARDDGERVTLNWIDFAPEVPGATYHPELEPLVSHGPVDELMAQGALHEAELRHV